MFASLNLPSLGDLIDPTSVSKALVNVAAIWGTYGKSGEMKKAAHCTCLTGTTEGKNIYRLPGDGCSALCCKHQNIGNEFSTNINSRNTWMQSEHNGRLFYLNLIPMFEKGRLTALTTFQGKGYKTETIKLL